MSNNFANNLSTGNKLIDLISGGLYGLADATQSKGQYVPMFNWQGNGLASGGMQYLANPNYRDYASGAQMFGSLFNKNNDNSIVKPSQLFNSLFNTQKAQYPLKTTTYLLPQVGNVGGGTIGDYGNAYNSFYDYSLPSQRLNLNKFWEK